MFSYIKSKQNRGKNKTKSNNNSALETGEMTEKQITKDKLAKQRKRINKNKNYGTVQNEHNNSVHSVRMYMCVYSKMLKIPKHSIQRTAGGRIREMQLDVYMHMYVFVQ